MTITHHILIASLGALLALSVPAAIVIVFCCRLAGALADAWEHHR